MARLDKNSSIWRVGKLEQLFRHTGLFLWSLRGGKSNVIITGYSDHWRGAASCSSRPGPLLDFVALAPLAICW